MGQGRSSVGWLGARARSLPVIGLAAGATALLPGLPAAAATVGFPKDKPKVTMQVPDDWTVQYTAIGLEIRSPQKDSILVGNLVKRARTTVDAWNKIATETMSADGISFDKTYKPKQQAAAPAPEPQPAHDKQPAPEPAATPPDRVAALEGAQPKTSTLPSIDDSIPMFARQAAPAPPPPPPAALAAAKAAGSAAPTRINGMTYHVAQYFGAKLKDKPVDVQLVVFNVAPTEVFLLEQASSGTDDRAVAITMSVKRVP